MTIYATNLRLRINIISKELLSDILGIRKISTLGIDSYSNVTYVIKHSRNETTTAHIDLYKLAHKCKEWALKQGYVLQSNLNSQGAYCIINDTGEVCSFQADTEPEAIVKCAEHIRIKLPLSADKDKDNE